MISKYWCILWVLLETFGKDLVYAMVGWFTFLLLLVIGGLV